MSEVQAGADPRLLAARTAHDAERMRALLGSAIEPLGRGDVVEALTVERIFYLPGEDFTAAYRVQLRRGAERETQLLFGNIRYGDDAAHLAAKALRKAEKGKLATPRLGAAAYHLPELGMVLWTYPNDPRLKTLARSLDPQEVRRVLGSVPGPNGAPNGWHLGAVSQELVRYIPRKRCVFRFEVEWRQERGPDGAPRDWPASRLQRLFGKVYDDEAVGRQAFAVQDALWRAAATDGRWLRVPQPLGFDAELLLLVQAAVPGTHLTQRAAEVGVNLVSDIGRGLALLHQARLPVRPVLRLEDELDRVRQHGVLIARVHPEQAGLLDEITARLAAALPGLPRLPLMPAHGTFKLNHILHDGERPSLVDFDSMVRADPLYDVANFTSDLHYLEAAGALPAGRAVKLGRAFHESYVAHVPWGRRDDVLDWYVACLLVRKQAMKCVKHLHADAEAKVRAVLHEAQGRIGRLVR
jgi:hypothetical protein